MGRRSNTDRRQKQSSEPRQKKSLGQVFLRTEWPIRKVVERVQSWGATRVIEIGPGGGVLTRALLEEGLKVTAIEKDDRFAERLIAYAQERGADRPGQLEIVNQDVLKFDLEAWLAQSDEPTAVVGNIPYNISTPIIMWVMPHLNKIKGANFMVQWEFGARVAGVADTKAYGSLSVYTQLRAKVEMDCKVDRTCFQPVPKVDSALITFRAKTTVLDEEVLKQVELVTRAAFNQRRKKLRNSTSTFLDAALEANCPIDLNRRADSLRPEEFLELAEYIFKHRQV